MFIIVFIITIALANCLEPVVDNKVDDETKNVLTKYLNKIPDIEPQYVIHEGLSKVISRYFKGKVSTFPLYKISLKLDRNPVKIPWALSDTTNVSKSSAIQSKNKIKIGKTYEYIAPKKANNTT